MDVARMDGLTRDLLLAQDGDARAFTRVVHAIQPDLRRFCIWQTGYSSDIDDIVQETFFRMFRGLHTFRAEARAMSWVFTIARRVCIDRSRISRRENLLKSALRNSNANVEHYTMGSTTHLSDLVRSLPHSLREPFVLVKIFGCSYAEVSKIVGCPVGTVQSRVARARECLASLVTDETTDINHDTGTRNVG